MTISYPPIQNFIVKGGDPPVPVWNRNSGIAPFVYNQDAVSILYAGPKRDVLTEDINFAVPIAPLTGVSWPDDEIFVWSPHRDIRVLVLPGTTYYTGPPIPNDYVLADFSSAKGRDIQLGAGSTQTVYNDKVTGTSYTMFLDVLGQATPATPFTKLSMLWKDAIGGDIIDSQQWFILNTNVSPGASNCLVTGRGPTNGQFLTCLAKNYDSAVVDFECKLLQSARVVTRHDFRSVSNNILGTYTYAGFTFSTPVSAPAALIPGCSPSISMPAGQTTSRIHALYSGSVWLSVLANCGANPLSLTVSISAVDPDFATPAQLIYQTTLSAAANVNAYVSQVLAQPRTPVIIQFTNNSASAATVVYGMIDQEFAS